MTQAPTSHEMVDVVKALMAAINNIRLYPPTSAMVTQSIDTAFGHITAHLEHAPLLVFAESEGTLLIGDHPVGEKDRKKPQIPAFLDLLRGFEIKSLTFMNGLEKEELAIFLKAFSAKPDTADAARGLHRELANQHLPHFRLDEKVFVAMSKDQAEAVGTIGADDAIIRYMTGEGPADETIDKDRLREMASDPEWVTAVLSSGLQQLSTQKGKIPKKALSERFGHIMRSVDEMAASVEDDKIPQSAVEAISRMDVDTLNLVLSDHLSHIVAQGLFDPLVERINDEQFKRLAVKLKFMAEKSEGKEADDPDRKAVSAAYSRLMDTDRAQQMEAALTEKYELEVARKKTRAERLRAGLSSIMKGEKYCFMDDQVMQSLPDTVDRLYARGRRQTAEQVIERLRQGLEDDDETVRSAAAQTLSVIHETIAPLPDGVLAALEAVLGPIAPKDTATPAEPPPDTPAAPLPEPAPAADLSDLLSAVDRYVADNDTEGAVAYLADQIVRLAGEKNFAAAETLREKLFDVDPMALSAIVKTGEVIEAEKSGAIDTDFLDLWRALTDRLTEEERNALYYAFKEKTCPADHALFSQGQFNEALFFVNRGQLKLVFRQADKEHLLKTLEPGDVAGVDTFFDTSVCTTSLITLSAATVYVLDTDAPKSWEKSTPALMGKLREYCFGLETASDLLAQKGMDRRVHRRMPLSGQVAIHLLGKSGAPAGKPFRGNLSDVSSGGLSFSIRTAKTETARLLLGRKLGLRFSLSGENDTDPLETAGTVIGVKYHMNNDYSVHVKFHALLDSGLLPENA